jgi:hypothetical protein
MYQKFKKKVLLEILIVCGKNEWGENKSIIGSRDVT